MSIPNWRQVKKNLVTILNNNSNNCFKVVGFQRQAVSAEETKDLKREVRVFAKNIDFPESGGANLGDVKAETIFFIEFHVSAGAKGNLDIINDPNSSSAERASASSSFLTGSERADDSMDELFVLVHRIIVNALNYDYLLPKGNIAKRWISNYRKDDPVPMGDLVYLTGTVQFNIHTYEEIQGQDLTVTGGDVNVNVDIPDDDVEQAGVKTDI